METATCVLVEVEGATCAPSIAVLQLVTLRRSPVRPIAGDIAIQWDFVIGPVWNIPIWMAIAKWIFGHWGTCSTNCIHRIVRIKTNCCHNWMRVIIPKAGYIPLETYLVHGMQACGVCQKPNKMKDREWFCSRSFTPILRRCSAHESKAAEAASGRRASSRNPNSHPSPLYQVGWSWVSTIYCPEMQLKPPTVCWPKASPRRRPASQEKIHQVQNATTHFGKVGLLEPVKAAALIYGATFGGHGGPIIQADVIW